MMRRLTSFVVGLSVVGISTLFLLAAVRCAKPLAIHLTSPGWSHCHSHQPISHLPLWQLVTISILPVGLELARRHAARISRVWQLVAASGQRLAFVIGRVRLPALAMVGPPCAIRQSYADGLSGGHPTFG